MLLLVMVTVNADKIDYKIKLSCRSDSMSPSITCNDTMIVNSYTGGDLLFGDVYCYRPDYRNFHLPIYCYVCPRLVDVKNDYAYFSGDNNDCDDPPVETKYIAFHVKEVIKV